MKRFRFWTLGLVMVLGGLVFALAASAASFPGIIPLPVGFQPEGVAVGRGHMIYSGSLLNGAIYQADLSTGEGNLLFPGMAGRAAAGLAVDDRSNLLYAAGAFTGEGYVYDLGSGQPAATLPFSAGAAFINDVIVTRAAAYFTNSFSPELYRVPLGPGGRLPDPIAFDTIPLTGDFQSVPGAFNANGLEATPDGRWLIVVNSALGALYRVDPQSGVARQIDLGGGAVPSGDGILLAGQTLYVVQNFLNQIGVVHLNRDLTAGTIGTALTSPDFRIPTTAARFGSGIYAVNARFNLGIPAPPGTEFEIVRVEP